MKLLLGNLQKLASKFINFDATQAAVNPVQNGSFNCDSPSLAGEGQEGCLVEEHTNCDCAKAPPLDRRSSRA